MENSRIHLLVVGPTSTKDRSHKAGGIETGVKDLLSRLKQSPYGTMVKVTYLSNWNGRPAAYRPHRSREKASRIPHS